MLSELFSNAIFTTCFLKPVVIQVLVCWTLVYDLRDRSKKWLRDQYQMVLAGQVALVPDLTMLRKLECFVFFGDDNYLAFECLLN